MWDSAAENNLKVPSEVQIDTVGKNPLVTLKPAAVTKVNASDVFKTFRGNYFYSVRGSSLTNQQLDSLHVKCRFLCRKGLNFSNFSL